MLQIIFLFIIAIAVIITIKLIEDFKKPPKKNYNEFPYIKTTLLTDREREFYYYLRPIAKKYNLEIFIKVSLSDIVNVKKPHKQWQAYWNKIQAKHIDFLLCNQNLEIVTAIELDDNSHKRADRVKRDNFIDGIFLHTKLNIVHINKFSEIDDFLNKILRSQPFFIIN